MGQQLEYFETLDFNRKTRTSRSFKRERGHLTHVLIVLQGTTIRQADMLDIKFRKDGGKQRNVVDDISLNFFAQTTDLKMGLPAFGSVYQADMGGNAITTENQMGSVYFNAGINAVLIPVGSIYLETGELQFKFDFTTGGTSLGPDNPTNGGTGESFAHIFGVDTGDSAAHILSWVKSYDLDTKHTLVREIYLQHAEGETLFPSTVAIGHPNYTDNITALDVKVELDIDGRVKNGNLYGFGALTTIFGELNRPASSSVRIFQDDEGIPSNIWAKITGAHREQVELIICQEIVEPDLILEGHTAGLKKELEKTQSLEKVSPDAAIAYQAVGLAKPSIQVAKTLELMPVSI